MQRIDQCCQIRFPRIARSYEYRQRAQIDFRMNDRPKIGNFEFKRVVRGRIVHFAYPWCGIVLQVLNSLRLYGGAGAKSNVHLDRRVGSAFRRRIQCLQRRALGQAESVSRGTTAIPCRSQFHLAAWRRTKRSGLATSSGNWLSLITSRPIVNAAVATAHNCAECRPGGKATIGGFMLSSYCISAIDSFH